MDIYKFFPYSIIIKLKNMGIRVGKNGTTLLLRGLLKIID